MAARPKPGSPEYLAEARKLLRKIWKAEKLEATSFAGAVQMLAWDLGYQQEPLHAWLRVLGEDEGIDVAREHREGQQAGAEARQALLQSRGHAYGRAGSPSPSGVYERSSPTARSFDTLYEQLVDALNGLMREHDIDPQVAAAEAVKYVLRRRTAAAAGQARPRARLAAPKRSKRS